MFVVNKEKFSEFDPLQVGFSAKVQAFERDGKMDKGQRKRMACG